MSLLMEHVPSSSSSSNQGPLSSWVNEAGELCDGVSITGVGGGGGCSVPLVLLSSPAYCCASRCYLVVQFAY